MKKIIICIVKHALIDIYTKDSQQVSQKYFHQAKHKIKAHDLG